MNSRFPSFYETTRLTDALLKNWTVEELLDLSSNGALSKDDKVRELILSVGVLNTADTIFVHQRIMMMTNAMDKAQDSTAPVHKMKKKRDVPSDYVPIGDDAMKGGQVNVSQQSAPLTSSFAESLKDLQTPSGMSSSLLPDITKVFQENLNYESPSSEEDDFFYYIYGFSDPQLKEEKKFEGDLKPGFEIMLAIMTLFRPDGHGGLTLHNLYLWQEKDGFRFPLSDTALIAFRSKMLYYLGSSAQWLDMKSVDKYPHGRKWVSFLHSVITDMKMGHYYDLINFISVEIFRFIEKGDYTNDVARKSSFIFVPVAVDDHEDPTYLFKCRNIDSSFVAILMSTDVIYANDIPAYRPGVSGQASNSSAAPIEARVDHDLKDIAGDDDHYDSFVHDMISFVKVRGVDVYSHGVKVYPRFTHFRNLGEVLLPVGMYSDGTQDIVREDLSDDFDKNLSTMFNGITMKELMNGPYEKGPSKKMVVRRLAPLLERCTAFVPEGGSVLYIGEHAMFVEEFYAMKNITVYSFSGEGSHDWLGQHVALVICNEILPQDANPERSLRFFECFADNVIAVEPLFSSAAQRRVIILSWLTKYLRSHSVPERKEAYRSWWATKPMPISVSFFQERGYAMYPIEGNLFICHKIVRGSRSHRLVLSSFKHDKIYYFAFVGKIPDSTLPFFQPAYGRVMVEGRRSYTYGGCKDEWPYINQTLMPGDIKNHVDYGEEHECKKCRADIAHRAHHEEDYDSPPDYEYYSD